VEDKSMARAEAAAADAAAGTYTAVLSPDEEGWITAQIVEVPEALSQGKSVDEARANVTEALELALEWRRERGEEIPIPGDVTVSLVRVPRRS